MSEQTQYDPLDKAQFERLFKTHFQYLCNFAQQYVGDADAAQDLCQKVFIMLWEKREHIDPRKSIKSYLFTAVKNRALNYLRDHKKYRSRILDVDCADFDLIDEEEDHFAAEDLQQKIAAALAALPEKCRLVFEMSRFQQMKYREIAEELEISQKTVEAHMSKAMKSLRKQLRDYVTLMVVLGLLG